MERPESPSRNYCSNVWKVEVGPRGDVPTFHLSNFAISDCKLNIRGTLLREVKGYIAIRLEEKSRNAPPQILDNVGSGQPHPSVQAMEIPQIMVRLDERPSDSLSQGLIDEAPKQSEPEIHANELSHINAQPEESTGKAPTQILVNADPAQLEQEIQANESSHVTVVENGSSDTPSYGLANEGVKNLEQRIHSRSQVEETANKHPVEVLYLLLGRMKPVVSILGTASKVRT